MIVHHYIFPTGTNHALLMFAYVVDRLSRYTSNTDNSNCNALERGFKYLKGTLDYSLHYTGFSDVIEGYIM